MISPRTRRIVYIACGFLSLGLAIVGWILPIVPGTPLVLLAGWCFIRSSPRLHQWLRRHRLFGRFLRDSEEGRGLPWTWKAGTLVLLWGSAAFSAMFVAHAIWLRAILAASVVGMTWHILRLPSRRR
jgi:uncharacterized membrane protein YbaN (DUF454 family)